MNVWLKVVAVRIYPSGGLICQKVSITECMSVPKAIHLLSTGKPICLNLDDLENFLVALESVNLHLSNKG